MTDASQRQRAEAAFGHMQRAATEVIAAAHDALDLLEGAVVTADLGGVLETFAHVSHSVFKRPRPPAPRPAAKSDKAPDAQPAGEAHPASPGGRVQRISVR